MHLKEIRRHTQADKRSVYDDACIKAVGILVWHYKRLASRLRARKYQPLFKGDNKLKIDPTTPEESFERPLWPPLKQAILLYHPHSFAARHHSSLLLAPFVV